MVPHVPLQSVFLFTRLCDFFEGWVNNTFRILMVGGLKILSFHTSMTTHTDMHVHTLLSLSLPSNCENISLLQF